MSLEFNRIHKNSYAADGHGVDHSKGIISIAEVLTLQVYLNKATQLIQGIDFVTEVPDKASLISFLFQFLS